MADAREHLLAGLALGDEADDQARCERAEDEVEVELVGEEDEDREQCDGEADGELAALVHRLARDRDDPRRPEVDGDPGRAGDDEAEAEEQHDARGRRVRARQEERDDDDRPELAGDCGPERVLPSGEGRTPASERIGTSVPSAVVARATASSHPDAGTPAASSAKPAAAPSAIETPQPTDPRASRRRGNGAVDHLDAREEEEEDESEGREELDVLVALGDVEDVGPDQDAQEDLDDDGREDRAGC